MLKKKIVSLLSVAAVTASLVLGTAGASVSAEKDMVVPNSYPQGTTLSTFLKDDYRGYESVEINYEYDEDTLPKNAGDTFAFLVFDTNWGGWDKINVGQNNPVSGQTYSQTVPISTIESALSTGNAVYGFNLITDNFGDGEVIVNSVKLIDKAGQEAVISGNWTKGTASAMDVTGDLDIVVDANAYNIYLNGFSAYGFTNPTVDVTLTYGDDLGDDPYKEATLYYVENFQQENEVFTPVEEYGYKEATAGKTVTYSFSIDENAHKLAACFDACTVKEIKIYDKTPDDIVISGNWTKGTESELTTTSNSDIWFSGNEEFIYVFNFSLKGYRSPTVEVTANYSTIPEDGSYMQAELYSQDSKIGGAFVPVTETGTKVYTFDVSNDLTEFNVCFDGCTVTQVRIYDNRSDILEEVSGLTASEIAEKMGKAWNLGNALESTIDGVADETLWNNKFPVSKELFDAVKDAGFQTVRIPVSYLDKIVATQVTDEDGEPETVYSVDDAYMARVKQVVDSALASGLYVVIDMHNDGGTGIDGMWLDITKTGTEFDNIKTKFSNVWSDIATTFKDYDQHLLFEGFNELNNGYDTAPSTAELNNVNTLNQAFVDAVRSAGGANTDRVLILNGYNADIDYTVSGFVKPTDTSEDRLMLSVHYYEPYDFTLNGSGTTIWDEDEQIEDIVNQLEKISTYASSKNVPVFIGEYGAIYKNNDVYRASYISNINEIASSYSIVTSYWDNGYTNEYGCALFNRETYTLTESGKVLISAIVG